MDAAAELVPVKITRETYCRALMRDLRIGKQHRFDTDGGRGIADFRRRRALLTGFPS